MDFRYSEHVRRHLAGSVRAAAARRHGGRSHAVHAPGRSRRVAMDQPILDRWAEGAMRLARSVRRGRVGTMNEPTRVTDVCDRPTLARPEPDDDGWVSRHAAPTNVREPRLAMSFAARLGASQTAPSTRQSLALYSPRAVFVAADRARARRRRARSRPWRRGRADSGAGPQVIHADSRRRAGAAVDARRGLAASGRPRSGRRRARPAARHVSRNRSSRPPLDAVAAARPAGVRRAAISRARSRCTAAR